MKILYVEDELSKNIDTILNMFDAILGAKVKRELKSLNDDDSGFMVANGTVKDVVEKSGMIKACCSFTEAMAEVTDNYQDYELFIIDRNLENEYYELNDIQQINRRFTEKLYDKYCSREGDFLFSILRGKIDSSAMFYFLTANASASDAIRCQEEFEDDVALERFTADNIIEKSNGVDEKRLLAIIEKFKQGNFRFKMKGVFEIFDNGLLPDEIEKEFIEILRKMNKPELTTIKGTLARIRRVQEAIYIALNRYSDDIIPVSLLTNDKGFLKVRPIIRHLDEKDHHNGIIKSFAYDVYGITSDNGSHTPYQRPDYQPTEYTVQAMTYALCDLLLWFKSIVEQHK